jgi:hypothetical protein
MDLAIWSDTNIEVGSKWDAEIRAALSTAELAICLVSADFFASSYITSVELPAMLEAAIRGRMKLCSVVVGACLFSDSPLSHFHAFNTEQRPLSAMRPHERDAIWMKVARRVCETLPELPANIPLPPSPMVPLSQTTEQEFQKIVDELLRRIYGTDVSITSEPAASPDVQADFVLVDPNPVWGGKAVVEVKRNRRDAPIGVSAVQQLVHYMQALGSSQGILITTGPISEAARDFAQDKNVRLIDGRLLVDQMRIYGFDMTLE